VPKNILQDSVETFYKALNDYQIDRRGDVGSWVREEAMWALKDILAMLNSGSDETLQEIRVFLGADRPEFYERFVGALLQ
jgi:hypothetical protein